MPYAQVPPAGAPLVVLDRLGELRWRRWLGRSRARAFSGLFGAHRREHQARVLLFCNPVALGVSGSVAEIKCMCFPAISGASHVFVACKPAQVTHMTRLKRSFCRGLRGVNKNVHTSAIMPSQGNALSRDKSRPI